MRETELLSISVKPEGNSHFMNMVRSEFYFSLYISYTWSLCCYCNLQHFQRQLYGPTTLPLLPPEVVFYSLGPKSLPLRWSRQLSPKHTKSFIISQRSQHHINLSVSSPPCQSASACLCTFHARSQHSMVFALIEWLRSSYHQGTLEYKHSDN